jgi:uncharacterized protein YdaU (DUF1376 family)
MMHYYQHHIGDFIKATARLSDTQAMGYLRLLWMYYDSEKPLKPDVKVLAFQIGSTVEDTELLLESFFILCENGWHHTRCDKEIADYRSFLDKKSNAGKASAERRKNKSSTDVQHLLNNSLTVEQLTTNHKPLTTNQKPKKDSATSVACPDSVSQQVWNDWMTVRKEKKAKTLTETGWNGFVKQVEKAGWSLEQAISHCCLKQWVGFEAAWVAPKLNPADNIRLTVPASNEPDAALEKIKADDKKAVPIPLQVLRKMAELRKAKV